MSIKYQVPGIKRKGQLIGFLFSLLVCIMAWGNEALANAFQLSSQSYISLITCAPGKELYSAFGHSAVRVYDPLNHFDRVYNYGTFDFNQPNFYSNYAMGRPIFMLSVWPMGNFMDEYMDENRSVVEDVFNLTQEQKQRLFEFLQENNRPENRQYRYDYIYDNCSTRIRDILVKVTNGAIAFDTTNMPKYTFRQLMDLYLGPQPWGDLGIDLALSSVIDTTTKPYYYMFLPDFLRKEVLHGTIMQDGVAKPLVAESVNIFTARQEEPEKSFFTPLVLFWTICFLFAIKTAIDLRRGKVSLKVFDVIFFAIVGLVGMAIAHISFFSDHHAARNYNLLWAIPTHFIFAFLLPFSKKWNWVKYYFLAAAIITSIAFIGGATFIPQQYNTAFYPLMLTLIMRSGVISLRT